VTASAGFRPLRILVVNWQDRENPQGGGAETHLHEIFGRMATWGHSVTLLASGWKGCAPTAALDGIAVHRAGGRYSFSLAAPAYYRRALATERWDVVVEDLNKVPLFTPVWTRAPVALLVHHLFGATAFQEASLPVAAATWLLERPIPRVFAGTPTVAVSESTRQDLATRGMDPGLIQVIPNGMNLEVLRPAPDRGRYPEPTLLYLGRLKRYKGVDLILRALSVLRARGVPARLLVGGKGNHEPALRALATELGLGDAVSFLGFVPEERKLELFQRSWVHVLASPKEGWGISNLEAAACATPTVASDAPGLRDSVLDGTTGFLVPHGDVEALAASLERLLLDPGLRERLGVQARVFAEGFSWEGSARAIEAFLTRVVRDSPRG
jgi:glycosyltransferase involved in cell wall biosynthesis